MNRKNQVIETDSFQSEKPILIDVSTEREPKLIELFQANQQKIQIENNVHIIVLMNSIRTERCSFRKRP